MNHILPHPSLHPMGGADARELASEPTLTADLRGYGGLPGERAGLLLATLNGEELFAVARLLCQGRLEVSPNGRLQRPL